MVNIFCNHFVDNDESFHDIVKFNFYLFGDVGHVARSNSRRIMYRNLLIAFSVNNVGQYVNFPKVISYIFLFIYVYLSVRTVIVTQRKGRFVFLTGNLISLLWSSFYRLKSNYTMSNRISIFEISRQLNLKFKIFVLKISNMYILHRFFSAKFSDRFSLSFVFLYTCFASLKISISCLWNFRSVLFRNFYIWLLKISWFFLCDYFFFPL